MKNVFSLYFLLFSISFFGQENQPWRSFFSYNDIVDVAQSENKVIGAASSALFEKNLGNNELKTITSIDGLKVEAVTAVYYSAEFNKTLVGNSNGLLNVINGDNSIVNKIDIVQENTVPAYKKRINHIYEYEGKAYISCDFGISVLNLATLEFGDTYFLGSSGEEIAVTQTTVLNGIIYAASRYNGVRYALINNPNLNDFNQWSQYLDGGYIGVVSFVGILFVCDNAGTLYRVVNDTPLVFATFAAPINDLRVANNYMVATSPSRINVYNEQLVQVAQINEIPLPEVQNASFSCATVAAGNIYIGTAANGMFSTGFNNLVFENITPNGPQRSNIATVKKASSALWVVYGDYTEGYNPHSPNLDYFGVSKFTEMGWSTTPNDELFNAACIVDIVISPTNENLMYVSSYHNGLIKIENDVATAQYTYQPVIQNGPESLEDSSDLNYKSVRINSLAFDKAGNLWMTNTMIEKSLKELKTSDTWTSYSVEGIISNPKKTNYGKMAIDKNGTKWIPTNINGVLAYNEGLDKKLIIIEGENGNLPSENAKCVAIDHNNRLWIGTNRGLRVLPGIDRFTTEDVLMTNPIIILEDGLAQELMYEQALTDITVDGANNKWLATGSAGAFLVSPDGQQTLFHFTKDNSPLPSNVINDIEIDNVTGEVFFATDKGMVSYRGTSTDASGDLSKVYVFPNPVRPDFQGDVNISALTDNANVKITDIEGNLVFETTSEGGSVLWDTRAFGKYKVASGVYMIFISSEDGTQTKVKKVMVIR